MYRIDIDVYNRYREPFLRYSRGLSCRCALLSCSPLKGWLRVSLGDLLPKALCTEGIDGAVRIGWIIALGFVLSVDVLSFPADLVASRGLLKFPWKTLGS